MAKYRDNLPQLSGDLFLTDSGLETVMIFHEGFALPEFAVFTLLDDASGRAAMRRYYDRHAAMAREHGVGFVLESQTWRASREWGARLGLSPEATMEANRESIRFMDEIRADYENGGAAIVISGQIGSRGDGYRPSTVMTADEAEVYHAEQIGVLANSSADMISAFTMPYVDEVIGMVRAAGAAGMPIVVSFTVETDGRLPSGRTLKSAIETVDEATDGAPLYYMLNCAHPEHFESTLATDEPWVRRIRGLRANASKMSHEELDNSEHLDDGDPEALAGHYRDLKERLPNLNVFGGCCGTDCRHVAEILSATAPLF